MRVLMGMVVLGGFLFSKNINFHTVQFDPLINEEPIFSENLKAEWSEDANYLVIQFNRVSSLTERENIEKIYGVEFTPWYIHHDAFIVKISDGNPVKKISEIKQNPNIRWAGMYQPGYKFTREAWELYQNEPDIRNRFYVHVFDDSYLDEIVSLAENLGAEIEFIGHRTNPKAKHLARFGLEIEAGKLSEIAKHPGVYVIGRLYEKGLFNDASRWVIQTNVAVDTSIWRQGIRGDGVIIGHNDNGLDPNHCFFDGTVNGQPKIVSLYDYDGGGFANGEHGTHTAGSACGGDDNISGSENYKGMAPHARLVSQEPIGADPPGFHQILQNAYDDGARIHTNSWGYQCQAGLNYCGAGGYEAEAIDLDQFVWDNPDMTVFFAAANGGDCADNSCGNDRRQAMPSTAKNDITIVATRRANDQEYKTTWSSFGAPINLGDERLGTDITAPGEAVNSADNQTACGILAMDGTSMATPTAAGAGALVVQYYRDGYYGNGTPGSAPSHNPSAALVKATLIASARDMQYDVDDDEGGPANSGVPNIYEGGGRITLEDALWFGEQRALVFREEEVSQGGVYLDSVRVQSGTYPFIAVLAYTDYPGAANTYPVLVNNLDLEVQDPDGNFYRGNVASGGWAVPNPTAPFDTLNNWEIVKVQNPTPGKWYVRVIGDEIPQPKPGGILPFAFVITADTAEMLGVKETYFLASCVSRGILVRLSVEFGIKSIEILRKSEKKSEYTSVYKSSHLENPLEWIDTENLEPGVVYTYKALVKISTGSIITYGPVSVKFHEFLFTGLRGINPNIIHNAAKIQFGLDKSQKISLYIISSDGRKVKALYQGYLNAGIYTFFWDNRYNGLKGGTYFLVFETSNKKDIRKIQIVK